MLQGQPAVYRSINTETHPRPAPDWIEERHVPIRPLLIPLLERNRLAMIGNWLEVASRPGFRRNLAREMDSWQPEIVHVVLHGTSDFYSAWQAARERGCRFVISVHDHLRYSLPSRHPLRREALRRAGEVWRDADHRFVVSEELAREYAGQYGDRPWDIITDGLKEIPARPAPSTGGRLRVYFMGLFHYHYRHNLTALTGALARLRQERPDIEIDLFMRCGGFKKGIDAAFPARVLPFADQAEVLADMTQADLLYLPLPFGERHEDFTRFSLSTKMVSYLGSGLPILYHGPRDSAAARLLERYRAAITCYSLDETEIVTALLSALSPENRGEIAGHGLDLARTEFSLANLRGRFLRGLLG
jgi:hypothetical protein